MARILIAEPSKTLAALVKLSLAELGAELEVAHDGASALAAARARVPDALVCDQGLPGLDGYALAHTVKQLATEAGRPPVAALMLVPEHTTPDPERLAYVGIGDVLVKPFERAVLLERVRALLDARSTPALPAPTAPAAHVGRAPAPSAPQNPPPFTIASPYPTVPTPAAAAPDLGPRLALELPALVDQAVQRLLPALVQAAVERAVSERVGPIVEIAVQRALAALLTPATIERAVASEVQGAVGEIGARVEGQLEADLLARLDRFARETLPARLQTQAEQIIWKIVPTIAEDIVKDEIKRLTQEPS